MNDLNVVGYDPIFFLIHTYFDLSIERYRTSLTPKNLWNMPSQTCSQYDRPTCPMLPFGQPANASLGLEEKGPFVQDGYGDIMTRGFYKYQVR